MSLDWPGKASVLALGETLAMPLVLLGWGISTLGCGTWALAMLLLLPLFLHGGWGVLGWSCVGWSLFALPLGWWNFGQFMRYFSDGERKFAGLGKVALISAGLVLTNPFLVELWFFST